MNTPIPQSAFAAGIMNKEFHERLIADLPSYAATAGIPQKFVWTGLSHYCKSDDYQWVMELKSSESCGLAYIGKQDIPPLDKMMAIAGCCLRNYMDARVMTLQDVLQRLRKGNMPEPTLLLIPNFYGHKSDGAELAKWVVPELTGLLMERRMADKKTVLYVENMKGLNADYGSQMHDHIEYNFQLL